MTMLRERSEPAVTATDPFLQSPTGTWTIDPSDSSVSLAWHKHRLWAITGRLHCFGVIHLDALPPVGVIQFEQPSGLPVLTIALNPASVEPHESDLETMPGGPDAVDVRRHRWWTLHSQSLEVLPTGAWRVMATLTASARTSLIELHLELDPKASSPDWLVLRGRGVPDRRGFDTAKPASTFMPRIRVDLAVRARRVEDQHPRREER